MVRPSPQQLLRLESLRDDVIHEMRNIGIFSETELDVGATVSLGLLRKNSTQRHGVTRWNRQDGAIVLQTVDLHPALLEDDWESYASFVLYHELLHAIGNRSHDKSFRQLELLWPDFDAANRGVEFTAQMRLKRAKWLWMCPKCNKEYPRQQSSKGKYQCRTCGCRLLDVPYRT
ncbi:MAG TPA: hypothetical protein QGI72_00310 [Poseidonia sp.]|nr:hypothetical protein [Poseidonia sp.]